MKLTLLTFIAAPSALNRLSRCTEAILWIRLSPQGSPKSTRWTMADPTAISVILDPLALVFNTVRSLNWSLYLSWAFTVVAFPFKILIIPLSFFANILFVALSPAFYIVAYAYSGVKVVLGLIASLEVSAHHIISQHNLGNNDLMIPAY